MPRSVIDKLFALTFPEWYRNRINGSLLVDLGSMSIEYPEPNSELHAFEILADAVKEVAYYAPEYLPQILKRLHDYQPGTQVCRRCGKPFITPWMTDDETYEDVSDGMNILCIDCFYEMATEQGQQIEIAVKRS